MPLISSFVVGVLGALMCGSLAVFALLRRHETPLARQLFYVQLGGMLLAIGEINTSFHSQSFERYQIWLTIGYLGPYFAPAFWWKLVLRLAQYHGRPLFGQHGWIARTPMLLAIASWTVVATNPWHGWALTPRLGTRSVYHLGFWLSALWIYLLMVVVFVLSFRLWRATRGTSRRRQLALVTLAPVPILAGNLFYVLSPTPPPFDVTVLGFSVACATLAWGIFCEGLFGIVPIALSRVILDDPDGLALIDEDGNWLYANRSVWRLLGCPPPHSSIDALTTLANRLENADGSPLTHDQLRDQIDGGAESARIALYRCIDRPGQLLHGQIASIGAPGRLGGVAYLRLHDITEAELARDAAAGQAAALESVLGASEAGLAVFDPDNELLYVNRPFWDLWGIPEGQSDGQALIDGILPSWREPERILAELNAIDPLSASEHEVELLDGRTIALVSHAIVAEGKAAGRVWTCRDVTAQRVAHRRLIERGQRLQAQQRMLVELAQQGTAVGTDLDRRLECIAERAAGMLEVDRVGIWLFDQQRTTLACRVLFRASAGPRPANLTIKITDYPRYFAAICRQRVIAASRAAEHPETCEFADNYLRDHDVRSILDAPIHVGGELRGVVGHETVGRYREWDDDDQVFAGSIADTMALTLETWDRQRTEEALQHSQKLESIGLLAGGIAHDFNNLLVGILGNADLALGHTAPAEPQRRHLEAIISAAQRASELTQRLLAYAGQRRFDPKPVDLATVISETVELLGVSLTKNAAVDLDLETGLPAVVGDDTQLRQIVMNLLVNAAEAIDRAPGRIFIATRLETLSALDLASRSELRGLAPGTYLRLEIRDTGCGMPDEVRSRMFDPFFSTKFTGRGLGLAAVLGIIRGHHGMITVDSVPGEGTTCTVHLPASTQRPAPPRESAEEPFAGDGVTILVVDDDDSVRDIAQAILSSSGFTTIGAASGDEALQRVADTPDAFGAVLLDLTMPGMSGEDTARELGRRWPQLPIVLSSGYSANELDRKNPLRGTRFIQKPYRAKDLVSVLCEVVAGPATASVGHGAEDRRADDRRADDQRAASGGSAG